MFVAIDSVSAGRNIIILYWQYMTLHLIPIMPKLVAKYIGNDQITCNLLKIVVNFDVEMYSIFGKSDVRIVSMIFTVSIFFYVSMFFLLLFRSWGH